MRPVFPFLVVLAVAAEARAQDIKRDVPYADPAQPRQVLDVYSPRGAKDLPVVFWIHGGGWQTGDKKEVQLKPQAFNDKGFVFVSTNYRLLPAVDMGTIVRDVAKAVRWVHDHIAGHGGDPVDGDTYDVPAIIETAETRWRVHDLPRAKFGHREKFGNDPAKHKDFSAVTHVTRDKNIPPFFVLHVAEHPDTSAQAQ